MPTQSDSFSSREWTARTDTPRRSVFGNYQPAASAETGDADPGLFGRPPEPAEDVSNRKEKAVARAFLHRFLAKALEDPTTGGWDWLCSLETRESVMSALASLGLAHLQLPQMQRDGFESYQTAYTAAFGHAARGSCPLNEIEYGDIKADPLFQPHRLADLAAFYRAFGLELAEDGGERHDHICLELEFMCVLAAKEAYALDQQLGPTCISECRGAQKKFLREHLGRWVPAFTRRLGGATANPFLRTLAELTRGFVEAECGRFGVSPGSQDLLLRPVEDAVESMCDSCGISSLPPGA